MKILWVVNTIFPELAKELGQIPNPSGSWMHSLVQALVKISELNITVVTVYTGKEIVFKSINNIDYYLIPNRIKYWGDIFDKVQPDLVHIHGSEYKYGLDLIQIRPKCKYVLSIQGLMGECARTYLGGMTTWEVIQNITIRDILKNDNLLQARKKFYKRAQVEKEYFQKVDAVIGRTEWDKAHTHFLNPKLKYYHCEEMLRDEFLTGEKWSFQTCEKYSIFMSGGGYPLKGLHQVLKALYILKNDFPQTKLYIAGYNFIDTKSLKSKLKLSGYGLYIKRLIRQLGLENHVIFTGPLNTEAMKKYFLNSNVYVCASSIENGSNSLLEAKVLGVPFIASYVGGIPSLIANEEYSSLYDFSDNVMLSYKIRLNFEEKIIHTNFNYQSKQNILDKYIYIYKDLM